MALTLSTLSFAGKGCTHDGELPEEAGSDAPAAQGGAEEDTTAAMQRW